MGTSPGDSSSNIDELASIKNIIESLLLAIDEDDDDEKADNDEDEDAPPDQPPPISSSSSEPAPAPNSTPSHMCEGSAPPNESAPNVDDANDELDELELDDELDDE
jgi:hypothetical protein